MPFLLRKAILLSLPLIIFNACNSVPENKSGFTIDSAVQHADTKNVTIEVKDSIVLKNIVLNEKSVMGNRLLAKSQLLGEESLVKLYIDKIDSIPDRNGFKYHMLDTLFLGNEIKIVLIGREYAEENILWMVMYGKNNHLLECKELYYDNSEGFRSVNTEIKNNRITINTNNDYAETPAEQKVKQVFFIDENYKLSRKF